MGLFAMGVRETIDPDMWWHLQTGEFILSKGVPDRDIFSFTVFGEPWIAHEWLSQLLLWLVYALAGLPGLIIAFALVILLIFGLLYQASDVGNRPFLPVFLTLWAALASALVWGARPQMFNLLLGASFILILEWVRQQRLRPIWLWMLVPLTMLWANLHSGYLFGIVLAATFAAGEIGQQWWQPTRKTGLRWPQLRLLIIVIVLSFLAAAFNPNGIALWSYPFFTLGSHVMQTYIREWRAPYWQGVEFWPFFLLVAYGLVSLSIFVFSKRRWPYWSDVLLFAGTAVASFVSRRHIPLFAIVTVPILVRWTTPFWPTISLAMETAKPFRRLNLLLATLVLVAVVARTAVVIGQNEDVIAAHYPVAAVDFLEENGLVRARGYNSYNWGGYLIWRGLPVFVDGRADVYGDAFLLQYRETFEGQANWERPLILFDVSYVLIEPNSRLSHLLENSPNWQLGYEDGLAQIFLRHDIQASFK